MKRLFLILAFILMPAIALADWSVTVTWTPSPGPNLANEEVLLDGVMQCDIAVGNPSNCGFTVVSLSNQEVSIVSYNDQGLPSVEYVVGSLLVEPSPATGGIIIITPIP